MSDKVTQEFIYKFDQTELDALHKQIYILKKETTELQDKNEFLARELKRSISQLGRNEHTKMEKRVEELEQRFDCLRIVSSTQYECYSCGDYQKIRR